MIVKGNNYEEMFHEFQRYQASSQKSANQNFADLESQTNDSRVEEEGLNSEKKLPQAESLSKVAPPPIELTDGMLNATYQPKLSEKRELVINSSQSFNTASNNQSISQNVLSNNHQEESSDNILQQSLHVRKMKLMSKLLMNQSTPKQVEGNEVDSLMKSKIESNKKKVLNLQIEVNEPEYGDEGKLVHKEEFEDDDEGLDNFEDIFNAHLLDEEVLDQQIYNGSMSSDSDKSAEANQYPMQGEEEL